MAHDFGTFVACCFKLQLSADKYFDVVSRQKQPEVIHLSSGSAMFSNIWHPFDEDGTEGHLWHLDPYIYQCMTSGHMCLGWDCVRWEGPFMACLEVAFPCRPLLLSAHTPGACVLRALENRQPNALTQDFEWAVLRLFASDLGGSCHLRWHRGMWRPKLSHAPDWSLPSLFPSF